MSLLEVSGLRAGYGKVEVVHGVDLALEAGELVGLVGPNGAGKSTLLAAIVGAVKPTAGTVTFDGTAITGQRPEDTVRRGVALVPEGRHIFPALTVEENLKLGLTGRRRKEGIAESLALVEDLFPVLGSHRHQSAGMLSGGQQQQLAIARALVAEPSLLLLDEPSLGLSPTVVADVFDALAVIRAQGTAILVVEQRAHLVLDVAERTLVLREGLVQAELAKGASDDESLTTAYFGGTP